MNNTKINAKLMVKIYLAQKSEITEFHVYSRLAKSMKGKNKKILQKIANEENSHAEFWKRYSQKDIKPSQWKIFKFFWIAKILGFTFAIKLMEKGEEVAQINYEEMSKDIPEARKLVDEEEEHEKQLIELLNEERLDYIGSIVLGLNDALVELTGALAGFTLAFQNTHIIALAGLITGIAASFSMASSEYLSNKADGQEAEKAFKAAIYTGIAYILTVILLVLPFFLVHNYLICMGLTLLIAILIILFFNLYVSIAKDVPFRKRFLEMVTISMGVAGFSFFVGYLIRVVFGIDI